MSEQESSNELPEFLLPSESTSSLLSLAKVSNSGNCSPQKLQNGNQSTPEKREKYHRESAEVAKKKIKLDINPMESPDKNGSNNEGDNLCEQYECSNKSCCIQINSACGDKAKVEIDGDYWHVTKCEHVCMICYEDLIRV